MPKVSPIQSSFNAGEFSPLLYGRVDADRYKTGLAICKNYLPLIQGCLSRRSGSAFVAEVKDSSKATRLQRFEFSITQAYVLEFGDTYIRFFKDNAQIVLPGPTPYEIASPYLEAHLFELKFTQSADVLYITHPLYKPRKLTRTSHTSWTLTVINFLNGPFLPTNATSTTIVGPSPSGTMLITASSTTGINNNQGFLATDVGRQLRYREAADQWGWAIIVGYTSTTQVTVTVQPTTGTTTAPFPTSATKDWRLGVWSDTTGYPAASTFHEDRLFFGGATLYPERVDGSNSSNYEDFKPTDDDNTIKDNQGIAFSFNSNDVNAIRWLASDEKGLLVGTVAGEWVVRPSSTSEALTPKNVTAKRATSYGSANIQPAQTGKASIFIQRAGKKVREINYFFDVDGFRATDVSELSEHITGTGITQLGHQKTPQSLVWAVREDGQLAALTYERSVDSLKAGWSRHVIGGFGDAAGGDAIVESVAVIPSPDTSRDDVWLVVKRYIDGGIKRYVEYFTKFFDDLVEQKDAFFVDSGLSYDDPKTISNITQANPAVLTSTAHGFSNGAHVLISGVKGMTEVNTNAYYVANATANTFELEGLDSTGFGAYISGGEVRKYVSTISGLDHLEGQTVSILGDGAVQPDRVVSSGAITLQEEATTVQVGLKYQSEVRMLRIEAGAADGTALGKTRRIHRLGFLLHRTLGMEIGTSFDRLDPIIFRETSDPMTRAVPLFSGIKSTTFDADYDYENLICWRQEQPLPSTILAVLPQMHTQDRG